jgi:hypothetical protein
VKEEVEEEDIQMSDVEIENDDVKQSPMETPEEKASNRDSLKRKREGENDFEAGTLVEDCATPIKRARSESPPPPPPPPPPPADEISPEREPDIAKADDNVAMADVVATAEDGVDLDMKEENGSISGGSKAGLGVPALNGKSTINGYHTPKDSHSPEESPNQDISSVRSERLEGQDKDQDHRAPVEGHV